ncbi:carbohydrate ABC transporter permease [Gottschalkiaceae bacterium SANA]|nr:carbohydrate ABC transporter permease [Gottschalkiaceae bacterium SANA]
MNKSRMKKIGMYLFLTIGAIAMILPFLWMLSTSLKSSNVTFVLPPKWIPENPKLDSYRQVFETVPMGRFFFNSIFVAAISTFFQVLICSMAGYAFARIQFKGREVLFYVYLATLMVPQQVTLTPLFIMMNMLGWANTYQALILPGIFSAFGTFLMRQFFQGIPNSIEEAAFIDGAGYVTIFFRIIIHLAKPVFATLFIFAFMASWNNFLWPLIITTDTTHMTLPLGLASLKGRWTTDWNVLMAGTLVSIVPMMFVYIFTQKYIIKGLTHTGLK